MLTAVPAQSEMANVTAFVDVTNIAQYTQKEVTHRPVYALKHKSLLRHAPA